MSADMLENDIKHVISIDISPSVIEQMRERYKDHNLLFQVMDCRNLLFAENEFDMVVDKGTIDALYCMEDANENIEQSIKQISNVLIPTKQYICISLGSPEQRKDFIDISSKYFTLQNTVSIKNPNNKEKVHYVYIFKK